MGYKILEGGTTLDIKIAITGEIRSGKDTVCDYIRDLNPGLNKLYFAEGIERIIREYFPEAYQVSNKPRKHFQEIGQFMRTVNESVWINSVERKYTHLTGLGEANFILTDLRQVNEYEWLKENGFIVIKVETEQELRIERMKASGDTFTMDSLIHSTEQQIKDLPYDYLITNNTTLTDLYEQIDYVLYELNEGGR